MPFSSGVVAEKGSIHVGRLSILAALRSSLLCESWAIGPLASSTGCRGAIRTFSASGRAVRSRTGWGGGAVVLTRGGMPGDWISLDLDETFGPRRSSRGVSPKVSRLIGFENRRAMAELVCGWADGPAFPDRKYSDLADQVSTLDIERRRPFWMRCARTPTIFLSTRTRYTGLHRTTMF